MKQADSPNAPGRRFRCNAAILPVLGVNRKWLVYVEMTRMPSRPREFTPSLSQIPDVNL